MQPLSGVKVVEAGSFITAPYAGMILADLGAEVIKIERPGTGGPFRNGKGGIHSPIFRGYNRNKKSLTLDITKDEGKRILRLLADRTSHVSSVLRIGRRAGTKSLVRR